MGLLPSLWIRMFCDVVLGINLKQNDIDPFEEIIEHVKEAKGVERY